MCMVAIYQFWWSKIILSEQISKLCEYCSPCTGYRRPMYMGALVLQTRGQPSLLDWSSLKYENNINAHYVGNIFLHNMYINILCNLFCQNISYIFNSLMSRFRIRNPHICVVKQHTSYKYIIDSLTSIFHKFTYLCGSNCLLLYCGKDCSPASPPSSICINYNLFLTAKIVHQLN